MHRRLVPFLLLLAIIAGGAAGTTAREDAEMATGVTSPTITVVYDNRSSSDRLDSAWGFACVVEGLESTVLFDTGGDSPTLLRNMKSLGIVPESIDAVVLSHAHDDHAGGLPGFLDVHADVTVYLLEAFPATIGETVRARGARVVTVGEPLEICRSAAVSGDMARTGEINEQCLLLSGEEGVALVTGCAHPGIADMVERAKEVSGQDVLVVLGGFHLLRKGDDVVDTIASQLKELGVQRAVPCHCTGDQAIERFAVSYGDAFTRCAAGTVIALGDLQTGAGGASRE